jgi:hypothetical protein
MAEKRTNETYRKKDRSTMAMSTLRVYDGETDYGGDTVINNAYP